MSSEPSKDNGTAAAGKGHWFLEFVRSWGPPFLIVLVIRSVVFEPFRIPSGSMVPTLQIGDHIMVTKYSYGLRIPLTRIPVTPIAAPQRGDVVVFVYPGSDTGKISHWVDLPFPYLATLDYVKRVVGVPGDTIEVRDNVLYINGEEQPRTYTDEYPFRELHGRGCDVRVQDRFVETLDGRDHEILNAKGIGLRMANFPPTTVPEGHVFTMGDNRDHSSDGRVWGFVPLRNIKGKARFVWLSYDQCEEGLPLLGRIRTERLGDGVR